MASVAAISAPPFDVDSSPPVSAGEETKERAGDEERAGEDVMNLLPILPGKPEAIPREVGEEKSDVPRLEERVDDELREDPEERERGDVDGAFHGLNASIFAARMKSFSERPSMAWVQSSTTRSPHEIVSTG